MSTLDGPIWSRYRIALACPTRSHFQRTLSRERWGHSWDERYRLSREGQEKSRRKEKEKTGDQFYGSCGLPFCSRSGGSIVNK